MSAAFPPLLYPASSRSNVHPAPLVHTRPDFIAISRLGGLKSAAKRAQLPQWKRSLPATLRVMRRWHPNDPILSMPPAKRKALLEAAWEQGFKAGAGYKRS